MYLTIKGLVIRVSAYKETDAIITLLTPDHGKIAVKARGLRRKNSPLVAPCQLMAFSEFTLFEYRNMYTINEAHSIELFRGLRKDLNKLSLATYFAQVADVLSQEDLPNPELLSLVLNCLHVLCTKAVSEEIVKAVFELRSVCLAGYEPDLSGCHCCGAYDPDRLDISRGMLECSGCFSGEAAGIRFPVTPGMLDSMRYICSCDPKRLFSFQCSEETACSLAQLTESYLCTQLERGFTALDFYKSQAYYQ